MIQYKNSDYYIHKTKDNFEIYNYDKIENEYQKTTLFRDFKRKKKKYIFDVDNNFKIIYVDDMVKKMMRKNNALLIF